MFSESEAHYSDITLGFTAFFVFLIGIVGTFGNLLAALALLYSPKLRQRPSTLFMVNLPACLIPVCAFGMPMFGVACIQKIKYNSVMLPEWVCIMCFVIGLILSQVHIHTICALALNRLIAVMWPSCYKKLMTTKVVTVYLIILWIYSALLWLPLAFGVGGKLEYVPEELMVSMSDKSSNKMWKGMHVFITYIVPILFTGICYLLMYMKVRLIRKATRERRIAVISDSTSNAIRQWEDHVTKTILVIAIILFSCSVPHLVIHVLQLYMKNKATWLMLHVVFWLQFCLDPIVYVIFSRVYRRATFECLNKLFPDVKFFQTSEEFHQSNEKTDLKGTQPIKSPKSSNQLRLPPQKIEFSSEVHRDLLDPKNIANTRS